MVQMDSTEPFLAEVAFDAHKYSRGIVGVVAGSSQYPGAAVLSAGGARRGGAGYVKYLALEELPTQLVLQAYPDVVPISALKDESADAWAIGSGSPAVFELPSSGIVVLDGSAMTFANMSHQGLTVITPHEGEAAKLGYKVADRSATALKMASDFNVIVVLKGPGTVVATPEGNFEIEKSGGRELATAGSGDILAGLLASMLASWRPTTFKEAAKVALKAVKVHSAAGKLAAEKAKPVVATDILAALPKVMQ